MRFSEINSADARRIRGYLHRSHGLVSSDQLVEQFLQEFHAIVPSDYICWHVFSADFGVLLEHSVTSGYEEAIDSRMDAFAETVLQHPILTEVGFEGLWNRPCRLSDFAGAATFRENPLYREVYRHLDARYQLMFHVVTVGEHSIAFTVNRWLSDFTDSERQKLHYLSLGLRRLLAVQHERGLIERRLESLTLALEQQTGIIGLDALTTREVSALGAVYSTQTLASAADHSRVSLDTFKGQIASAREKLGVENTNQLRAALRELGASVSENT